MVCRPSSSAFLIFVHSSQELSPVQDTSEQGHIGFDFIVLDKESLDLKVLGLISSKVKQAFDCDGDKKTRITKNTKIGHMSTLRVSFHTIDLIERRHYIGKVKTIRKPLRRWSKLQKLISLAV